TLVDEPPEPVAQVQLVLHHEVAEVVWQPVAVRGEVPSRLRAVAALDVDPVPAPPAPHEADLDHVAIVPPSSAIQPASNDAPPLASRVRASAWPSASPSAPVMRSRNTTWPSSEASMASTVTSPPVMVAWAPAGRSQSPPSSARKARSASTARRDGRCSIAASA